MWALRPPGRNCGSKDTQHSCRYESGKGESHDITLSFLLSSLSSRTPRNRNLQLNQCHMGMSDSPHHYPSLHPIRQQLVEELSDYAISCLSHVCSCRKLLGDSLRYHLGDSYPDRRRSWSLICCTTLPSKSMLDLRVASLLRWHPPA